MHLYTLILIISVHVLFIAALIFTYFTLRPPSVDLKVLDGLYYVTHEYMVHLAMHSGTNSAHASKDSAAIQNAIKLLKTYEHRGYKNLFD